VFLQHRQNNLPGLTVSISDTSMVKYALQQETYLLVFAKSLLP